MPVGSLYSTTFLFLETKRRTSDIQKREEKKNNKNKIKTFLGSREMGMEQMGGGQELHVLAVDDSLVERKVIEKLLKISCCKVTAVESGSRALQYLGLEGERSSAGLDGLKVNLILTDYSMPEMTGYELLKKIKGSTALRQIPVVIMSSENVVARIDRCLEEGAEEFLMKPVKLSDLKRIKDVIMKGGSQENGKKESRKRKHIDDHAPTQPLSSLTSDLLVAPNTPSFPLSQQSSMKCSKVHVAVDQS